MTKADRAPVGFTYHIPHHAVTRKFRVVFDASCKTTKNLSLNDVQLTGPRLQEDLWNLLIRFRNHRYGLITDIRQMYRCVGISPEQWELQRIFWRSNIDRPIEEYWLTTATFGMTSAPHCAIRAMQQCAKDHEHKYPKAAKIVHEDFYVDDCLTGGSTLEDVADIRRELTELLAAGTFYPGQWHTNAEDSGHPEIVLGSSDATTVLGLRWLPAKDELAIRLQDDILSTPRKVTKRIILSKYRNTAAIVNK